MKPLAKCIARAVAALAASGVLPGCIGLPVGGFRTITGTWTEDRDLPETALPWAAEISARVSAAGNDRLTAGMGVQLSEIVRQERLTYSVKVKKGKWWAIGLFPGLAEAFYAPSGGLAPASPETTDAIVGGCLVFPAFSVLELPFGPWECSTHYWEGPHAECLAKLPLETRHEIGAKTRSDGGLLPDQGTFSWTHTMLLGFHKFCTYTVGEPVLESREPGDEHGTTRQAEIAGPYGVEVSIPELAWCAGGTVEPGALGTTIPLPFRFPPGEFDAQVRFSVPRERLDAEEDPVVRQALEAADGQAFPARFTVKD